MLVLLQAVIVLRFSSSSRTIGSILPTAPVHLIRGATIPRDQLYLAAIVLALACGFAAVFRYTRFGIATRAAAENEKGAVLLGLSPERLGGTNWMISTLLAATLGIIATPVIQTLDPSTLPLLVVPALGAALIGGLTGLVATVVAGFAIGMAESWLQLITAKSWFPHAHHAPLPGVPQALPFVIVVIVLVMKGRRLPERGSATALKLPALPYPTAVRTKAATVCMIVLVGLFFLAGPWRASITASTIGMLVCLSSVVITGLVGQISLMQMTIAGVSAFGLTKVATEWGVPFPLGLILAAILATVVGIIVSMPAQRVRGVNLGIVTLAAAVAMEQLVFNNTSVNNNQLSHVGPPRLFGATFGPNTNSFLHNLPNPFFGLFCLVVGLALTLAVVNLRRSPTGQRMISVRSNERAAAAAGIDIARTKLLAFGIAAFIAGVAGSLSAYRFGSVGGGTYGSLASLSFFAFAVLGGITSTTGAISGGLIVSGGILATVLTNLVGVSPLYTTLIAGVGMTVAAVKNPEGIAGETLRQGRWLLRQFARRRQPGPEPLPAAQPLQAAALGADAAAAPLNGDTRLGSVSRPSA
jgi:branched-chain amino acid transport system permease protein